MEIRFDLDPSSSHQAAASYEKTFSFSAVNGDKHQQLPLTGISSLSGIILGDFRCDEHLCIGLDLFICK